MTQQYGTLFKRTKTGKVQQWHMEIDGDKYRTVSGLMNGKLVTSAWTTTKPKNVGKKNERTGEMQAISEVESAYAYQLKGAYYEDIGDIDKGCRYYEPMLAEEYGKRLLKKAPFNAMGHYSQPKLDGMRCIVTADGMWSREGEKIVSCPHIFAELQPLFVKLPKAVVDGELYNHDLKHDFDEIMSILRQSDPTPDDLRKSLDMAQYHIYDLPRLYDDFGTTPFSKRFKYMSIFEELSIKNYIRIVKTDYVTGQPHLDRLYDDYLENGYEGQMVREDSPYENDRTWSLLKRKEFQDAEFILTDIQEGKGNWAGKAKRAFLVKEDGTTFDAGITGTTAFCVDLLARKEEFIGKWTTVNFANYTPAGKPRFPRVKPSGWNRTDIRRLKLG